MQTSLVIGDSVFARTDHSKVWRMGNILKLNSDCSLAKIQWIDESAATAEVIPVAPELVQSIGTRERKKRISMEDEEDSYREAIGLKKLKRDVQRPDKVKAETKGPLVIKISKNSQDARDLERLSDRSLRNYLDVLGPFILPQVYDRIAGSDGSANDEDKPVTSQPPQITGVVMRDYQIKGVRIYTHIYINITY